MKLWSRAKSAVRNLFRKPQVESQLDDEIRACVAMMTDERIAAGISASEARRTAQAEFGGVEQVKQAVRDSRAGAGLELLWQDMRLALRQLRKSPGFTLAAVLTLALGIGANTAIFTVVNAVLLKPLTYPDADRIVKLVLPSFFGNSFWSSIPEFHACQRQSKVFEQIAAYDMWGPGFNLTGDRPEQIHGIHVSEGYFRLFGAPVILGRTFTPQEDSPNGGKFVVLSYTIWQRRFGGDPAIIGKSFSLGNEPYTIVGVIGKGFLADPKADIWLPFQFPPASNDLNPFFQVAARLRPGVTQLEANDELKLMAAQFRRDYDVKDWKDLRFRVEPLRDSIVGSARSSLMILLGACGLVLLIACANVANLFLARATGRKREFALRSALGASRMRIVRQLLTESVLLSAAGGILGSVLGFSGVRALLAFSPAGLPRIGENGAAVEVDWRVLGFTLAVSLFTGILFGLFPALGASRTDPISALKESGNRTGTGFRQGKARSLLVIGEVSMAMVLLIGAALLIRTLIALHHVEAGLDAQNVLTLEMALNGERYHKTAGVAQLSRDGREQLNAIPGVEGSAAAYNLPITPDAQPFQIVGRPVEKPAPWSPYIGASPGYLSVFKIPILRGRDFTVNDNAGAPGVALINQAFANKYWPHEDPLGRQLAIGKGSSMPMYDTEPVREIVGIVGDTHNNGLEQNPAPEILVPLAQFADLMTVGFTDAVPLVWIVRTHGDPHQVIAAVTEHLRVASVGFPVGHIRTMDEVMGTSTARERFNMLLLTIFGVVALVLAAIGIYSLMAYSVQQRTQEIGIRVALGADRSGIHRLVLWQGMRLTLVGVVVGIVAAFGLTRLIASFLFGVQPWDLEVFVSVRLILSAVALLAVWLPARRASKLDPMQALRAE
jgi:predicted permease